MTPQVDQPTAPSRCFNLLGLLLIVAHRQVDGKRRDPRLQDDVLAIKQGHKDCGGVGFTIQEAHVVNALEMRQQILQIELRQYCIPYLDTKFYKLCTYIFLENSTNLE